MATGTRTAKTAEQLKKDVEIAEQKLIALKRRAFSGEITEMIKNSTIKAEFDKIMKDAKGVTDIAILEAIGAIVGIKRLVISQSPKATRKPKAK
ncbi:MULTISPECIES: hypothetical protein [Polynucleobacter]|jgi:hypothetical protein|uniref:hypothetical protein n=1 Tax=Polynucleobacter TaxID=44013 RepID=UPI0008F880F1|nr:MULTISPECIES: hypothetical protein [Polynucleobacter]MDH6300919.1 hypothetical protein [Polynucleobacter sphagniphilus]